MEGAQRLKPFQRFDANHECEQCCIRGLPKLKYVDGQIVLYGVSFQASAILDVPAYINVICPSCSYTFKMAPNSAGK